MTRKYHNIRKAIQSIHNWTNNNGYTNGYTEIAYDVTEDAIYCEDHVGEGGRCIWADGVIRIGDYAGKDVTMRQLKADIDAALEMQ